MMTPEQLAETIAAQAADKKAIDVVELDVRGVIGYTDFFLVCSGNTARQVKAIHDGIHQALKDDHGILPRRVEGQTEATWILMDYLDVARPHLHPRGARLLPPRAALGRGAGPGDGARRARSSAWRENPRTPRGVVDHRGCRAPF